MSWSRGSTWATRAKTLEMILKDLVSHAESLELVSQRQGWGVIRGFNQRSDTVQFAFPKEHSGAVPFLRELVAGWLLWALPAVRVDPKRASGAANAGWDAPGSNRHAA